MTRMKALRIEKGLSQQAIADRIGTTQQAYANYERLARQADYETLKKISNVLNCSIDYLLGNTDDPRPIDEQLAGIDFALYGDKNNNPDNSIVIFNRNGEITKKEFSEEQMKYLKKFISSLTDEDYPDL